MNDKLSEKLQSYDEGKRRAHVLCDVLTTPGSTMPVLTIVTRIETKLIGEGFNILKDDILKILGLRFWNKPHQMDCTDLLSFHMGNQMSDSVRIPRLLRLHEHFAELVLISPIHPFNITMEELLDEVFGNSASVVALSFSDETALFYPGYDGSEPMLACEEAITEFVPFYQQIMLWPIPLVVESADVSNTHINKHSPVKHWKYRCVKCTDIGKLDSITGAILNGDLPVIWAAAGDDSTLQILVRVEADDRASWEEAGLAVVSQLQELGVSSVALDFENDMPLPGSFSLFAEQLEKTELLYYNPSLVEVNNRESGS